LFAEPEVEGLGLPDEEAPTVVAGVVAAEAFVKLADVTVAVLETTLVLLADNPSIEALYAPIIPTSVNLAEKASYG